VIKNLDGSGDQTLATRTLPDWFSSRAVAWSPDGKLIAAAELNSRAFSQIVTFDVKDGRKDTIGLGKWGYIGAMAWLHNGRGLIFASNPFTHNSQISEVSYPGGEERRITNDLGNYFNLSLTTGSATLVTIKRDTPSNLWIAPKGDSARARQLTIGAGVQDGQAGLAWLPGGKILYVTQPREFSELWAVGASGGNPQEFAPSIDAVGTYFTTPRNPATASQHSPILRANRRTDLRL